MASKRKSSNKKWIQGAIQNPGSFSAAAKAAHMTTAQYAVFCLRKGSKVSARRKKQAVLAQTLGKMRKKKTAKR